jgi:hypothetical protein
MKTKRQSMTQAEMQSAFAVNPVFYAKLLAHTENLAPAFLGFCCPNTDPNAAAKRDSDDYWNNPGRGNEGDRNMIAV